MKKLIKDLGISFIIAFLTFYMMYLIKGSILSGDLYKQGIDFLEYFKDHMNLFSSDWVYNWNIGLGDSMYALILYYLFSPFNIILLLFKEMPMIHVLPIFIMIKMVCIVYFSAQYFKSIELEKYKWVGALIYISSYNLIAYGNCQIMWLDTFVFLPLVLIGIEKIIKNENKYTYIIGLFIFIVSDFYLAVILIPHIAIYGIIRYIVVNGKENIVKYLCEMVLNSLIVVLMCSFILIPAIGIISGSAKEMNTTVEFANSLRGVISLITKNYVGIRNKLTNTYITLIGVIVLIPFFVFSKQNKIKLYYIHIAILVLAIFSGRINYILNLFYKPAGGNYRYNLFFYIYVGILVCKAIDEIIKNKNKLFRYSVVSMGLISMAIIVSSRLIFGKNIDRSIIIINVLIISMYLLVLIFINNKRKFLNLIFTVILAFEVTVNIYYVYKVRKEVKNEVRNKYTNILNHVGEKYGKSERVEIASTPMAWNIYLSRNISGVGGYHSLMNSNYKEIGKVLSNTNKDLVRNEFKGRNIIAQLVGTRYYISEYNYCPYINSQLIEEVDGYYIFEIDNNYIKYYSEDSIIKSKDIEPSLIAKDILLYDHLFTIDKDDGSNESVDFINRKLLKEHGFESNDVVIEESGDYYIVNPRENESVNSISFQINGIQIPEEDRFPNILENDLNYNEIYIGYLNKGDRLNINKESIPEGQLMYIPGDHIKEAVESMNSIDIKYINKNSTGLKSNFIMKEDGYSFFPIVYDENWDIIINGKPVDAIRVNGGFMAFKLSEGEYKIEMKYKNKAINIGILVTVITIIIIISYNGLYVYKKHKK